MTRIVACLVLAAIAGGLSPWAKPVAAQSRNNQRSSRPTTSPYLNLLNRNRRSTTLNYFNQVRPEQRSRSFESQTNRQFGSIQQRLDTIETLKADGSFQVGPTGHPTRFLDLGGYFGGSTRR